MSATSSRKNPPKRRAPPSKRVKPATRPSKKGSPARKANADGGRNVFEQLGFSAAESRVLTIKADLLGEIRKAVLAGGYSQKRIAEIWGQSQPRVSEIMRGRLESVTIDKLVTYLERLGLAVTFEIKKPA